MARRLSQVESKINSRISQAVKNYRLIQEGDKILVAISGGKDSLTLLHFLKKIQTWAPVKYELVGIHVQTDFRCGGLLTGEALEDHLKAVGIPYVIRKIKVTGHDKSTNCFWCSWNRRKVLFTAAAELGCNKIALGHHKDDICETILMNMLFNGNIAAMNVCQEFFKGTLHVIRPLCYVEERWTRQFAKEQGWLEKACNPTCPVGDVSKRKYIKDFIRETEKITGHSRVRTNIFNAVSRIKEDYINLKPMA